MGHYSNECPEKKADQTIKPNPFQKGHVNHMDVEEIIDQPDMVIGKFLINTCPSLVLFDSGASHSFISRTFVKKHDLPTTTLVRPIRVSSPGGRC